MWKLRIKPCNDGIWWYQRVVAHGIGFTYEVQVGLKRLYRLLGHWSIIPHNQLRCLWLGVAFHFVFVHAGVGIMPSTEHCRMRSYRASWLLSILIMDFKCGPNWSEKWRNNRHGVLSGQGYALWNVPYAVLEGLSRSLQAVRSQAILSNPMHGWTG